MQALVTGQRLALCARIDHGPQGAALIALEIGPRRIDCSIADIADRPDAAVVAVAGILEEVRTVRTRRGDPVVFATLADGDGRVEAVLFAGVLARAGL